jgi:rhomboid protease GluP
VDDAIPEHPAGAIMDPEGDASALRVSPSRDRIEEWALVLAAIGIDHQIVRRFDGTNVLLVAPADAERGARTLDLYEAESRAAARVAPAAPERGSKGLGIVVGMALIAFAFKTGMWDSGEPSRWFAAGVADATRIRGGEWWRAVTAMTLHADFMHLFGNVAAGVIFMGAAGRWLGSGTAALLIVLAGTAANLLTAWTERRDHLSVGASTATFAALGLVVGLQVVRRWRGGGAIRRRAWVAAGAGLALLAMLGMGAKADVFAHAFGLGVGTLLGVAAGLVDRPRDVPAPPTVMSRIGNVLLALVAAGAVVGAWIHALARTNSRG